QELCLQQKQIPILTAQDIVRTQQMALLQQDVQVQCMIQIIQIHMSQIRQMTRAQRMTQLQQRAQMQLMTQIQQITQIQQMPQISIPIFPKNFVPALSDVSFLYFHIKLYKTLASLAARDKVISYIQPQPQNYILKSYLSRLNYYLLRKAQLFYRPPLNSNATYIAGPDLKKLCKLEIDLFNGQFIQQYISLIQNANRNLEEITLRIFNAYDPENYPVLFATITDCPNLRKAYKCFLR
ncbi:7061_t:CDS:2, partial [Acaulospora colombiana]